LGQWDIGKRRREHDVYKSERRNEKMTNTHKKREEKPQNNRQLSNVSFEERTRRFSVRQHTTNSLLRGYASLLQPSLYFENTQDHNRLFMQDQFLKL